jgi:hypothetical protein
MKGMGARLSSLWVCLVLVTGPALTACGTPGTAAPPPTTTAPLPTSASIQAANPADAPVVAAYRSATQAFVHAGVTMNPNDPALPATMTGQELSTVKKNLIIDRASGLIARGDITLTDPHVISNDQQTAVLRDCQYSAILLVDAKTGQGASGVANGPQNIAVTATLAMVEGTWKVSLEDLKVGSCPLGY